MRALALLLAAALAAGAAPAAAAPSLTAWRGAPVRPVVLVPGLGGDPHGTWGWPDPARPHRPGMFHALFAAGYRAGETLFVAAFPRDAGLPQAASALAATAAQARRVAGGGAVDVLAHSSGALVLRYALDAGLWPPGVALGRVLLLAPVERGSVLAETVHRLALRQRAFARRRAWGPPVAPDLRPPEFRDEVDYVARRAHAAYEPLYEAFLVETRLLAPPGALSPPPDFAAWLVATQPALAAALTDPRPPRGLAPLPTAGGRPEPGRDLSRAYYERVALAVAQDAGRLLRPAWRDLRDSWQEGMEEAVGGEGLAGWARRLAWRVGLRLAGRWLEAEARRRALAAVEEALAVDPGGEVARVLVRERAHGVPAGVWLAAWNQATPRREAWRLVSTPLPLGVPFPDAAANDGFVELPATLLTGGTPAQVLAGVRAPLHHRLPDDPRVQRAVRDALAAPGVAGPPRGAVAAGAVPTEARVPSVPPGGAGRPADGPAARSGVARVPRRDPAATSDRVPVIHVVRRSRLTTDRRPADPSHVRWRWEWGDGTVDELAGAAHAAVTRHRYAAPGTYAVRATSFDAAGRVLLTRTWTVRTRELGEEVTLSAASARAPGIRLELEGPAAWVVGRPAEFRLRFRVEPPPHGEVLGWRLHPSERFQVIWHRPGDGFPVRGAATVRVRYRLPGGVERVLSFTAVVERTVDVAAPGLTVP